MKKPSVYKHRPKIPELFSFPISPIQGVSSHLVQYLESFRQLIPLFNFLAKQNEKSIQILRIKTNNVDGELFFLTNWLSVLIELIEQEIIEYGSSVSLKSYYMRVNMATYYVKKISQHSSDAMLAPVHLEVIIRNVKSIETDPEILWYLAVAQFINPLNQHPELVRANLFKILSFLKKHTQHQDAVLGFILQADEWLGVLKYPQRGFYERLEHTLPQKPWFYNGHCAQIRHQYHKKHLEHPDFFEFKENQKSIHAEKFDYSFCVSLPHFWEKNKKQKSNQLNIRINNRKLLQFAAHIITPSPLIPKIDFFALTLDPNRNPMLNNKLRSFLRTKGMCTSEGFFRLEIDIEKYDKNEQYRARKVKAIKSLERNFAVAVAEFAVKEKLISDERTQEKHNVIGKLLNDDFQERFISHARLLKALSGMSPLDALGLFYLSLTSERYGLSKVIEVEVKRAVRECLAIRHRADEILSSNKQPSIKKKAGMKLSRDVVDYLIKNKSSLLIHVSNPWKEGKGHSTHTLYVVVKYLPRLDKFQIILCNTGSGVNSFHKLAENRDERDRKEYHFVGFEPFSLKSAVKKNALIDYLYACFKLRHQTSLNHVKGSHNYTYQKLFSNLYLNNDQDGKGHYFVPIASNKKCYEFNRTNLKETFWPQTTGNCTVYSLKYAIKIMFDMNELVFGLLVDNLMLGLDEFISNSLKGKNSPMKMDETFSLSGHIGALSANEDDILLQMAIWKSIAERGKGKTELFELKESKFEYDVGDCMFEAVARFENDKDAEKIRELAVEQIKNDIQLINHICALSNGRNTLRTGQGNDEIYNKFSDYVELMSQKQTWGTNIELVALARKLKRPIVVITPNNAYDLILSESDFENNEPIFLNYINGDHYEPLDLPTGKSGKDILKRIRQKNETPRERSYESTHPSHTHTSKTKLRNTPLESEKGVQLNDLSEEDEEQSDSMGSTYDGILPMLSSNETLTREDDGLNTPPQEFGFEQVLSPVNGNDKTPDPSGQRDASEQTKETLSSEKTG